MLAITNDYNNRSKKNVNVVSRDTLYILSSHHLHNNKQTYIFFKSRFKQRKIRNIILIESIYHRRDCVYFQISLASLLLLISSSLAKAALEKSFKT